MEQLPNNSERMAMPMNYNIFTYDKLTERKTGAFTLTIFSVCLMLFTLIIMIFTVLPVSLMAHFINDTSIPYYGELKMQFTSYVFILIFALILISINLVFIFVISTINQLLNCYVELENGDLLKLRWQPRQKNHMQSYVYAKTVSEHIPSMNRAYAARTFRQTAGLLEAIKSIQNPKLISDYLEGQFEVYQIEDYLLGNIQLIKQRKKKIVIKADVMVKGTLKRKKYNIYCMYSNMERLTSICERRQIQ